MTNLTDEALFTTKRRTVALRMIFRGLKPNTIYTMTLNGVDHSFATRKNGGDYGGTLLSSSDGELLLECLVEVPNTLNFSKDNRVFEKKQTRALTSEGERFKDPKQKKKENVYLSKTIFELSDATGLSKAQRIYNSNILLPFSPDLDLTNYEDT